MVPEAMVGDTALDLSQPAGLDGLHEHVPLGRRQPNQVARFADADLTVIDLDRGARTAFGTE